MRITRWFAAAVLVAGSAGSVASAAPPTGSWSDPGQAPIFRESVQYPVGSAGQGLGSQTTRPGGLPFGVAIADFNHTGHPGLAINNVLPVPGGVGIMDNDGNGHFAAPRWFGAGLLKLGVQAGDLTGDGWPSLVVEDRATSGAWVMLNDHHGGFLPPRWHLLLLPDEDIKLADVDGNGTLDLVTANIAAFSFSVHYGNGDGTFGPPTPTFGPVGPCAVEPGDYTGHHNGLQDIAVVQFVPSVIQIWRNNGDHTFSYVEQHTIGLGGQAAHAVPLNRDRLPDLVTASTFSADVAVLVNNNPA